MSDDAECNPHMPLVDTPEHESVVDEQEAPFQGHHGEHAHRVPVRRALVDEEEEQEIAFGDYPPPMHPRGRGLQARMVGRPLTIKPDPYDGKSDWLEYVVYFEQMSEMYGWDHLTMAMVLGLSLRGGARSVLVSLTLAQRRDYKVLKGALTQAFCPTQQIYLYQAELKGRTKQTGEGLSDLGHDIMRLVKLAYPSADAETRETVAISAFLDALPGNAMETRLSVLRTRPRTMLEVVALAIEVETVVDANNHRKSHVRRDVNQLESEKAPSRETENEKLRKAVDKLTDTVNGMGKRQDKDRDGKKPYRNPKPHDQRETRKCYNCGKPGHLSKNCRSPKKQGNEGGQSESQ